MKFAKIDSRLYLADKNNNNELLGHIYKLVECFVHGHEKLRVFNDTVDDTVAGNALVAATLADRRIGELSGRVRELEKLAMTDELTGLTNRRGFAIALNRTLSLAKRYDERGVLIYIDLDDFKPVNDRHGHAAGDEVLRHVGRLLSENIRDTDYLCRLGGDEFAVLMPRTSWENGLARAGIIEQQLNTAITIWQDQKINIQASLGLQSYSGEDDSATLLNLADKAMYKTKRIRTELAGGKNNPIDVDTETDGQIRQLLQCAVT